MFISPSHKLQAYDVQKGVQVSSYDRFIENRAFYGLVQVPMNELIYNLAISNGYSSADANRFVQVARYESTFNPKAVGYASNGSYQFLGLFQILYPGTWNAHGCTGDIYSAVDNTLCAFKIQRASGWYQWEVILKYNI